MNVLNIARGEIGTKESPRNSNNVKYNTWYYGRAVSGSAYPWCVAFVQWCFDKAGAKLPYHTASCTALLNWYKAHDPDRVVKDPKAGDIVIYAFSATNLHIGIIENVGAGTVTSIEGNTSLGNDSNGGEVMRRIRSKAFVKAYIRPKVEEERKTTYEVKDGVRIVAVPAEDFKLILADKPKKSVARGCYANANFFSTYKENGVAFTLPVGHLLCDFDNDTLSAPEKKYMKERGTISGDKWTFDSSRWKFDNPFYGKTLSTLTVKNGKASIAEMAAISGSGYDYAVSGVPIMRNGADVVFKTFVKGQGYNADVLYATKHVFLGLKADRSYIYVMGWKSTTNNMVSSGEAYKKFKALGFTDVIKLDGGGSYYFNVNGTDVDETKEDRRVNAIIYFGVAERSGNPYAVPTATLRKGSYGDGVKWLQWQLNSLGFPCGEVDGDFGGKTYAAVVAFQKSKGLTVDGVVGPATRGAMTAGN